MRGSGVLTTVWITFWNDLVRNVFYSAILTAFIAANSSYSSTWIDRKTLPHWRYKPRQMILPIVRFETPYLAWFQEKVRTPTLDTYFAFTANLGTHTFFTILIPLLFWCGYARFGHA